MGKKSSTKRKLPAVYKPVGFALSWTSGTLASLAFRKVWKAVRNEDDAPDALDPDRRLGEILLASAVQGAIFATVRSVVDRAGARAIERRTGVWPAADKTGRA